MSYSDEEYTPGWLRRTSFNVEVETGRHPYLYLETVQPIHQSYDKTNTFFYQPRVSISAGDYTYNLGFGYRKLFSDNLLVGTNIFFDYEDLHEHWRTGMGFEALGQRYEARLNSYFGLSSKRIVEEGSGIMIFEEVADGFDIELGSAIPYVPWLKLYGSYFWYDFDKSSDKSGWKSRLEAKLTDWSTIDLYVWDDNKGETEIGGKIAVNIPFDNWRDIKNCFKLSDKPFQEKDLTKYTLIPVERNFEIIVEKWSENDTGNVVVAIGRNN